MKVFGAVAVVCVAATVVAGCSSNNGHGATGSKVVDGATFTFALTSDPGNLDPQASASNNNIQLSQFAYDDLVSVDSSGKILPQLATSWKVTGSQVVLTLHKGITCSDGSPFTAADAAANLNYVANPKSQSPFLGVYVPAGAHASADVAAGTVTMTTPKVAPFVLNGLASLPMVCAKGMANRKTLASTTDGTGLYRLTQAVSGDGYTYIKRAGYTWGPGGVTSATKGLPAKVVAKIIKNNTTAANLLLSGGLNAANIVGADATRVEKAHLFTAHASALFGEMWFNQTKGLPTADKSVRMALTRALDLAQLEKVVTSGRGTPATTFAAVAPVACPGNSIASALPSHDLAAAQRLLDTAGWKMGSDGVRAKDGKQLAVRFVYGTGLGDGGSAGAELATQVWKKLGVKVTITGQDDTALTQNVFGAGNWDVTWLSLNVSSPDQVVPFQSGAVPPKGTNFAHIDNAAYNAGVAKAASLPGTAGCGDWLKAESNLVSDADVIPFANQVQDVFGNKARFDLVGGLVPTSIRMLAG